MPTTYFRNVDLEVYSKNDLEPLATALGARVLVLFIGRIKRTSKAVFELCRHTSDADSTIRAFCRLIDNLPPESRVLWDNASRRDFSIGIQSAHQSPVRDFILSPKTLQSAAAINARVVITVYPPEPDPSLDCEIPIISVP